MGKLIHKLSAAKVRSLKTPGRHADGSGLYLVITKANAKSWAFLYSHNGKRHEMGLGSAGDHAVTLAMARERAAEFRAMLADGLDPKGERDKARNAAKRIPTFGEAADEYVEKLRHDLKNAAHLRAVVRNLTVHAAPIRRKPVDAVSVDDIRNIVLPLWNDIPKTSYDVCGIIGRVLDYATDRGWRDSVKAYENPARQARRTMPKKSKVPVRNFAALPYASVPAFVAALREFGAGDHHAVAHTGDLAALLTEFTILTCVRSVEARECRWHEFDLDAAVWTIPAKRMKGNREHRVPLSDRALEILSDMARFNIDDEPDRLVFPGRRHDRPRANRVCELTIKRLADDPAAPAEWQGITVHGFRSTFRDWCAEQTRFPREWVELCLAHRVGTETERAYQRSDLLERRREVMNAWAVYCTGEAGDNVVSIGSRRHAG